MKYVMWFLAPAVLFVTLQSIAQEAPEYQKWLKQQHVEFKDYVDKHDREFAEFLKREWRGVELQRGVKPDSVPKPVKIPVFRSYRQLPRLAVCKASSSHARLSLNSL